MLRVNVPNLKKIIGIYITVFLNKLGSLKDI